MQNMTNTPPLETARLTLRKFASTDLEALYSIYSDVDVNVFLPWFPLKSLDEALMFFENKCAEAYRLSDEYYYAICLKSDNIPIGDIHISHSDSHDFGFCLKKEYWHKGIVAEAGRAVIEYLKTTAVPFITATHDVKNPRSGNVMKSLGMTYCYSYEEHWQPKDILVTFRMYQLNLSDRKADIYKEYWNDSKVHFVEDILCE